MFNDVDVNPLTNINIYCKYSPINYLSFLLEEISSALQNIDTSKGTSPDEVPPIVLHICHSPLAVPLKFILNMSFSKGIFPTRWKRSSITSISKSGSGNNVENYGYTAISPTIEKLF